MNYKVAFGGLRLAVTKERYVEVALSVSTTVQIRIVGRGTERFSFMFCRGRDVRVAEKTPDVQIGPAGLVGTGREGCK